MNNPKTEELRRLMAKHGWTVENIMAMLPIEGQPRKYLTVYAWLNDSQHATVPEDCLEILRLQIKLAKCEDKLKAKDQNKKQAATDVNRRR